MYSFLIYMIKKINFDLIQHNKKYFPGKNGANKEVENRLGKFNNKNDYFIPKRKKIININGTKKRTKV